MSACVMLLDIDICWSMGGDRQTQHDIGAVEEGGKGEGEKRDCVPWCALIIAASTHATSSRGSRKKTGARRGILACCPYGVLAGHSTPSSHIPPCNIVLIV